MRCRTGTVTNSEYGTAPALRRNTSHALVLRRSEARRNRWTTGALWMIALMLGWIAWLLV